MRSIKYISFFILLTIMGFSSLSSATTNNPTEIRVDASYIKGDNLLSLNATGFTTEVNVNGKIDNVIIGDNQLSEIWENAAENEASSFGVTGKIASIHDANFVYFLITQDANLKWIALQFDSDNSSDPDNFVDDDMEPMAEGDDIWIFGETSEINVVGDGRASGQSIPYITQDAQNDLYWERIQINDSDGTPLSYIWEVKRALNTGDVSGGDVVFQDLASVSLVLASDVNHRTSMVFMKFTLSGEPLTGGAVVVTTDEPALKEVRDVSLYLFTYLSLGFLVGSFSYGFITILSVYILKKEVN